MARKSVFLVFGLIFVAIGAIGAFLPILPTTPFLIVALWFFARSSNRFHRWLYNHRLFGPPLQVWDKHRVIPPYAKIAATGSMSLSFAFVVTFTEASPTLITIMVVVMVWGAWFVLTKPSYPPAEPKPKP